VGGRAGTLFGSREEGESLYKGLEKREWGPSHANLLILQSHHPNQSSSSQVGLYHLQLNHLNHQFINFFTNFSQQLYGKI
jgi:hypothetical protein